MKLITDTTEYLFPLRVRGKLWSWGLRAERSKRTSAAERIEQRLVVLAC